MTHNDFSESYLELHYFVLKKKKKRLCEIRCTQKLHNTQNIQLDYIKVYP